MEYSLEFLVDHPDGVIYPIKSNVSERGVVPSLQMQSEFCTLRLGSGLNLNF